MPAPSRRRWPWLLAALFILVPPLLALQLQPALPAPALGADAQLAVQMRMLWGQLRPGAAPPGVLRQLRLGERELNALLSQLAQTQGGGWRAQVAVQPTELRLQAAQPLAGPLWLNLELSWDLSQPLPGQLPPLASARVGRLPLPTAWVEPLLLRGAERAAGMPLQALLPMLQGWRAAPRNLWLHWRWEPERAAQVVAARWTAGERAALLAQIRAQIAEPPAPGAWMPLSPKLQQMARLAEQRVQTLGTVAAEELRALLTVASLQALGRSPGAWLPESQGLPPLPPARLLLAGREDMAQHFLIAALLTWEGGERAAAAMGLAKELADRRAGSGFSFNDLAADEAGNRFGSLAARDPATVLRRLAGGMDEPVFFPTVDDLPEFLSERAFRERYGDLGSPAYEAEMARIRQRVATLPIHQRSSAL